MDISLEQLVGDHRAGCRQQALRALLWIQGALVLSLLLAWQSQAGLAWGDYATALRHIGLAALLVTLAAFGFQWLCYIRSKRLVADYLGAASRLDHARATKDIDEIEGTISHIQTVAEANPLVRALLALRLPLLQAHLGELRQANLREELAREIARSEAEIKTKLEEIRSRTPLVQAASRIDASLVQLKMRRDQISRDWEMAYANFSWWNKLKYPSEPDLRELSKVISELESLGLHLQQAHKADFERLDAHLEMLRQRASARLVEASSAAEKFIDTSGHESHATADALKISAWLAMLSVPISAWVDIANAGSVYDALRGVNGGFSDMSDGEIWWETLFMSPESLAGLVALTKGAYFEQLVASDTGGQLFEHFNHADTDIVIDGVAYQLKATSSVEYVNSVSDEIPVMATSEVAERTGAIDAGYSDKELTSTVDLALGGSVVDIGDSAVDAILAGVGGLGFFATVQGINHAAEKYENGGDAVEALFEGAGVAIEGTARGIVGAAEMGYKVFTSKTSRFIGRGIKRALVKLDNKMMEAADKPG